MAGPPLWRLERDPEIGPRLLRGEPEPGDVVLCRARRAVMARLIALAETTPHLATAIQLHQARTLHRCIDAAREVLLDARLGGPDGAVAWLFRFREAALLLDKAARIGP